MVLACGGGVVLVLAAPSLLLRLVTSDAPLPLPPVHADAAQRTTITTRMCAELAGTGTTRVSGSELTQLFAGAEGAPGRVRIDVDVEDRAVLDYSGELEPGSDRWINVHGKGGMRMEHGWFEHFTVDELTVGDWDLGQFTHGQELAMQANQNLAQQRAQKPQDFAALDAFEAIAVERGGVTLVAAPGTLPAACGSAPATPAPPEPLVPAE
jgi:hypothetical protein